jgi:hypothetical protein
MPQGGRDVLIPLVSMLRVRGDRASLRAQTSPYRSSSRVRDYERVEERRADRRKVNA